MKVFFKNGMECEISQEVAEIINRRILEGAKKWQTFSDQAGRVILMLNMDEIVCISE